MDKKDDIPKPKTIKKRGRKPKQKKVVTNVPKTRKKRGRKPKQRVYKFEKKTNEIVDNNIILRLPITIDTNDDIIDSNYYNESLTHSIMKEIPSSPIPSNSNHLIQNKGIHHYKSIQLSPESSKKSSLPMKQKSFSSKTNKELNTLQNDNDQRVYSSDTNINHSYHEIINSQIQEKVNSELPKTTSPKVNQITTNICCFWCCHPFTCKPCSIPFYYREKTFHVYGTFCSPECATAYLFDTDKTESVWDKYSLLNLMWNKIYKNRESIKKALPRTTLSMFGGNLSIEEFRSFHNQYREEHKLQFPPLIPIKTSIEKYSIASISKKTFIPLDNTRVQKARRNLKLCRKKPLQSNMNTLEQCMNLQYH